MPRKPNYDFERRERTRLKDLKNAEKAAAKKDARDRTRAQPEGNAVPGSIEGEVKSDDGPI